MEIGNCNHADKKRTYRCRNKIEAFSRSFYILTMYSPRFGSLAALGYGRVDR